MQEKTKTGWVFLGKLVAALTLGCLLGKSFVWLGVSESAGDKFVMLILGLFLGAWLARAAVRR